MLYIPFNEALSSKESRQSSCSDTRTGCSLGDGPTSRMAAQQNNDKPSSHDM
jgi:hypothetical protein